MTELNWILTLNQEKCDAAAEAHFKNNSIFSNSKINRKNQIIFKTEKINRQSLNYTPLKRDYYPTHYLFWGPYQQPYGNVYPHLFDHYRGTSDSDALRALHSQSYIDAGLADANLDAEYPVLQGWLADVNTGQGLSISQSKYLLNAAYLRVKNITFGYSLPSKIVDRIKVSKLRFYITGENLYEWSEIKKHIDPEATGNRGYSYPFHRKISAGVQLTF